MHELLRKNYVRHGLYITAGLGVWVLLMHTAGRYNPPLKQASGLDFLSVVIPIFFLYKGLKAKLAKEGKLSYKEKVAEGARISFVTAATSPFVFLAYYMLINPKVIEYAKQVYNMPNASFAQVVLRDLNVQFISSFVGGVIFSLFIAFFVRPKKTPQKKK